MGDVTPPFRSVGYFGVSAVRVPTRAHYSPRQVDSNIGTVHHRRPVGGSGGTGRATARSRPVCGEQVDRLVHPAHHAVLVHADQTQGAQDGDGHRQPDRGGAGGRLADGPAGSPRGERLTARMRTDESGWYEVRGRTPAPHIRSTVN